MADPTANRPAPTASGTLAKTPWVHLLLYALDKALQGTMELEAPGGRRATVFFAGGRPAKARASAAAGSSIGAPAPMGGSSDLAHLGRVLVEVGTWPGEATYAYYDGFDALHDSGGDAARAIDPWPLLWGILREQPPRAHVDAALARIGGSALRLARGGDLARLALPAQETRALELLRARPVRVADLAAGAGLGEPAARLLAYLLLVTRQVEVLPASAAPGPSAGRSSPVPAKAAPLPAGGAALPEPPASLAPELAERWREITARAATIDRADYFGMLDVARDATRDDVEAAFLAMAKRWHPDRLPPELAPVRDACSRVFGRMSEARSTLTDDEQRARYMRLLHEGSGTPETQETVAKVVEAATNFQKAEVCFKRNDLAQAETFCRKALALDPTQADYHALAAWLLALRPESQSPEKTTECVALMNKALALNERCEKAYFWRGMLHKRLGKGDLALRDFQRAADINPRNIDAAREVRLGQMRGALPSKPPAGARESAPPAGSSNDAGKPGLLGRLFKK